MIPTEWQSYSADVKRFARATACAAAAMLVVMIGGSLLVAGRWRAFDEYLLRAFRDAANPADAIGSRFVEIAVRDITALGGVVPLVLLVAGVAIYLLLQGHVRTAASRCRHELGRRGSVRSFERSDWAPPARYRSPPCARSLRQLSLGARNDVGSYLHDPRHHAGPSRAGPARPPLPARCLARIASHHRHQPSLSRCPLADRRRRRLAPGRTLGAARSACAGRGRRTRQVEVKLRSAISRRPLCRYRHARPAVRAA